MNTCSVAAGPAAAWACSSVNTCARNSYPVELEPEPVKEREKGYVDLLVDASLLLVSNDFPPEVQRHGARMLQHLLKFRREELSSFDCSSLIHQDDTDSTNMSNKFDDIIHPRMRCNNGAVPCHQVKGCLLLAEYNILCEAFDVVTSCLRSEQYKGVLHYLLKPLNKIWVQSEWRSTFLHSAFGLTCLFSDHFLEMVYKVVKFCENDLRQSTLESIEMQFCDLHSLLRLMLPFLLQLPWNLVSVAAMVAPMAMVFAMAIVGEIGSYTLTSDWKLRIYLPMPMTWGNHGQLHGGQEDSVAMKTVKFSIAGSVMAPVRSHQRFLQCIHSLWRGQISGSLPDQLESAKSKMSDEDVQQNKTRKLLEEIRLSGYNIIGLSLSIQGAFSDLLDISSFSDAIFEDLGLMHHGRAKVPYYFGKLSGPTENIEKFEDTQLLEFTREVSHLLGVLSSPESNNGLLHYLLTHDCLGSSRMSLFGYWVDDEATTSAISFCLAMDLMGGEKGNAYVENNFTCWLAKQKEDLRAKAFCSAPMEFNGEWNWEFEDEFQRYLPVYFNMLQEVDAMDDSAEGDCSGMNALLQKLNPQFRSKYAIYSSEHPYLREISRMQKGSDRSYSVIERLEENLEIQSTFDAYEVDQSVGEHKDLLLQIVGQLTNAKENKQFQPLTPDPGDFAPHLKPYARFYIQTKLKMSMSVWGLALPRALHTINCINFGIRISVIYLPTWLTILSGSENDTYARAAMQIHLHEDYDNYLASGQLDSYIYSHVSEDFSDEDVENNAVPQKFSVLDHDLIHLSLKRRAQIVDMHNQVCTYSKCLRDLLENESLKDRLMSLMSELNAEGFFDIDSNSVNWDNECFSKLVEKFKNEVFTGHSLPRRYTIQGIIDYWAILQEKDNTWQTFEKVVTGTSTKLIAHLPQFWRDTRYYKHEYYDIVREPLKKSLINEYFADLCVGTGQGNLCRDGATIVDGFS
uniref:Exportin-5 C-terminal domain-containing protein n=1 Tax=Oryza glaberrima TaxID=4538 RepID=I1R0J2_ORYGL